MLLDWLLAFAPLLLIVILMVRFRWSAARAGPAGWLAGVAIAVFRFGAGVEVIARAQTRAFVLALDVLMIVWGAFLLYRVADQAGAIRALEQALPRLTADRGMQALLIGWAFASFLQGVGGFGVPVVVTAPLLVGLGFPPLASVLTAAIGHSWSVTFGSLASSFQALIAATGIPGPDLAPHAATLLGVAGLGCGFLVTHIAGGMAAVRRLALPILALGAVMAAVQYVLATQGLWTIAGFGGGMAGLAAGLGIARLIRRNQPPAASSSSGPSILLALTAYIALIAITLLIQLPPEVRSSLEFVGIRLPLPAVATSRGFASPAGSTPTIYLLRHAGTTLAYASLISYAIYRRAGLLAGGAARRILAATLRGVISPSLSIASMVSLAEVMGHSGMTDALARGLAELLGGLFPLASPWIGALGAFVSGSNTNSNFLFAGLQLRTAELIGASLPWILAAQTAGGAIGSVVAPTKVVVGVSSAGEMVEEGVVMRHLIPYAAVLIAVVSLAVFAVVRLTSP
jgi:lactate permease